MSTRIVRVCPACRRPARTRPLPPDGFWQEQVLQRIGMYPYRCEACGTRFYRKVRVGHEVAPPRRPETHPAPPLRPDVSQSPKRPSPASDPAPTRKGPRTARRPPAPPVLTQPDGSEHGLSHEEFVDLIDHIKEAEKREGLESKPEDDEEV